MSHTKFDVRVFIGDKEISEENLHKCVIRSNTVDRIVNSVVERAIVINEEDTTESPVTHECQK